MSDTAQLFILAGIWTLVAAVLVYFIPKWPVRIVVFALLVGIPFWELPYGYYNFQRLCIEEARLQVLEPVTPQDSICIEILDSTMYSDLVKAGFARIEVLAGSDDRKRDITSGKVFSVKSKDVQSKYCLSFVSNVPLSWRILRHDTLVKRSDNDRIAARQSQFHWAGMWWQEEARPMLGRGGMCFENPMRPIYLIRSGVK